MDELGPSTGRVGRTWQADRIPRVIGTRWGRKSTRDDPRVRRHVEPGTDRDTGKLLLDLRDVAMPADAIGPDALVDLAEHQLGLGLAPGARYAALGVDHEVLDQTGARQRQQGEQRRGRVAARASPTIAIGASASAASSARWSSGRP